MTNLVWTPPKTLQDKWKKHSEGTMNHDDLGNYSHSYVKGLERRIAELEKDAARYRFLRNSKHEITLIADTEESGQLLYQEFPSGPLLDERIDTAAGKEQA
jgi:uncharacterized small protein (DUF1192 family)